jgi:hypothetical protein
MNTYEIKTVEDFMEVPPERLADCLSEFIDYLHFMRNTPQLAKEVGVRIEPVYVFNWIDDGKTGVSAVRLHNIHTGEFMQDIKIDFQGS